MDYIEKILKDAEKAQPLEIRSEILEGIKGCLNGTPVSADCNKGCTILTYPTYMFHKDDYDTYVTVKCKDGTNRKVRKEELSKIIDDLSTDGIRVSFNGLYHIRVEVQSYRVRI
jgi:hypothetical protein